MKFYNQQHQFYCGGDLHARTLYLHVLDARNGELSGTRRDTDASFSCEGESGC